MEVKKFGLKRKKVKKKPPRMKRNLNPNFGKGANAATDNIAVVAAPKSSSDVAKPSAPKELHAPPAPTGSGTDAILSQSDALAAVGSLDIDNWEGQAGNEENKGHLFALTDSSAKWKEVRGALVNKSMHASRYKRIGIS